VSAKPRLAATVILARRAARGGFEVFLTRRPESMVFLGGMYCFPGGSLRPEDHSPAVLARAHGLDAVAARAIIGAELSPPIALGLWIAALRELFEETGVLYALNEAGERITPAGALRDRLMERHSHLLASTLSFAELLQTERWLCDVSALVHFSRWQTPEKIAMRFDTHFFLAELPAGQTPMPTTAEVTHSVWLSPDRALEMIGSGALPVIFPTFASLRTLADFETLEDLRKQYGSRDSSPPPV
jgi:8-oxo-dGTP pyrophosphatase MutT (NUDIX family)